jgi:hypothetical protein
MLESSATAFITGLKSFRVIGFLWLLVIFIYALIGCTFFQGHRHTLSHTHLLSHADTPSTENDPMRFTNLHTAMLTLFWVSTLDGLQQALITSMSFLTLLLRCMRARFYPSRFLTTCRCLWLRPHRLRLPRGVGRKVYRSGNAGSRGLFIFHELRAY